MTLIAEVGQRPLDAGNAFTHRRFGQADQNSFGQAGGGVHFDFDLGGVDADEGEGVQFGEHVRIHSGMQLAEVVLPWR